MHPVLKDYIQRFQKTESSLSNKFFTQLSIDSYHHYLPYVFDIEVFCTRAYQALVHNEKVCIYSDYDTDAVTATATMYWGLLALGFSKENISFYAPDRFVEGYGMNPEAIEKLSQAIQLIISVDCGINSVAEAEIVLKSSNCDLVITDHHHLHGEVPRALGVINPRLAEYYFEQGVSRNVPSADFLDTNNKGVEISAWISKVKQEPTLFGSQPEKCLSSSLTGVGVAWFCLVWFAYFLHELGVVEHSVITKLNYLLPFVAIGTVADCQSILEPTNRVLVKSGLHILQTQQYQYIGLKELFIQTQLAEKLTHGYRLTSQDLGYTLSPILNSSGRISHARLSIETLLANSQAEAKQKAGELIATNQDRKHMVREILADLDAMARAQYQQGQPALWLSGQWSKGIIGLLASRLVSEYNIPTVVVSVEDSAYAVASLRAPEGFHIPNMLKRIDLFEKAGGHPQAAGFTADAKLLQSIQEAFFKEVLQSKQEADNTVSFVPESYPSIPDNLVQLATKKNILWVTTDELSQQFFEDTLSLDPFGQDFPLPQYMFEVQAQSTSYRWLGSEQKHCKLTLGNGQTVTWFNINEQDKQILLNSWTKLGNIWIQAKVSQNSFNGKTTLELIAERVWLI